MHDRQSGGDEYTDNQAGQRIRARIMNASMLRFAVLGALLIPLTGCPLGNAMPGLWLFHLSSGSQTLGLELTNPDII
jgi:hypothetical protein